MVQNIQLQQQLDTLQQVYQILMKEEMIDEKDVFGLADISPIEDLRFVELFFNWWVPIQDQALDSVEEFSDEYADLLAQRGFTSEEFRYIMNGVLDEEEYIEERVCQYLYIVDKREHKYFISTNGRKDENEVFLETYQNAIKKAIASDSSLLSEFFFNSKTPRYISKGRLKRHVYIPAGSGSGKSEVIKYTFHELIKDKKLNVILLEPHQDLSLEVLQFSSIRKQKKRVIFLDPTIRQTARMMTGENLIKEDVKFVINPFDIKKLDETFIESHIEELRVMFFSLLDNSATENMELVIEACIETLLRAGHARGEPYSIADLKRFMFAKENQDLVKAGAKHLKNVERRKVIQELAVDKENMSQRKGIYKRLGKILGKENLRRLVVGKNTVDVGKAMNSGKIIICNFSKSIFGAESSSILGKFFISVAQANAVKRVSIPKQVRPNSFLFVDECQRFLTPTVGEILEESRKYRLFMILANQFVGQKMTTDMKNTILANTGLKIAGGDEFDFYRGSL